MQQPIDQSVDQRKNVLVPGQYLDITLVAGQYKIYCPATAFDPPTLSVILLIMYLAHCVWGQ